MKFLNFLTSSVVGGVLAVSSLASANAADLTVGANIGNVPWEFEEADGTVVGFEVDLVNEIASRLGKSVEFVNIPFNGLFPAVQSEPDRHGGFLDHHHRQASGIGDLRTALL